MGGGGEGYPTVILLLFIGVAVDELGGGHVKLPLQHAIHILVEVTFILPNGHTPTSV